MGLFGPSFENVWKSGVESPGVIVGIRVREKNEDESTYLEEDYAVETGGEVLGIRQKLHPRTEVRLGMPVTVARTGKVAVIKWGQAYSNLWKMVKAPPRGIDDTASLGGIMRRMGKPITVEILSIGTRAGMLGLTTVNELQVRVTPPGGTPTDTAISKVAPAHYAAHLFVAGVVLPGFDFGGKPRIDWQSAALADPGVGVESPFKNAGGAAGSASAMAAAAGAPQGASAAVERDDSGLVPAQLNFGAFDRLQSKITQKLLGVQAAAVGADLTAGPAADDPVSWETYLAASVAIKNAGWGSPAQQDEIAQQHGIPAGEWDATNRRWQGRLMSDWRLGAAYGQAMS